MPTALESTDVLHVLWEGSGGGAERHVLDLAVEMQGRGLATSILYLSEGAGALAELDRSGVRHTSLHLSSGWDPRGPLRVARAVRDIHPRLLHDHVTTPWLRALLPRSAAAKIVATEHGHLLRESYTKPGARLWIERLGARRTDLYLAPSAAMANAVELLYRFPADRIRVIPHGIRPPLAKASEEIRRDVRRELGVDPETLILQFVGRLDHPKGILDLLEAFRAVAALNEHIVLVVAGRGMLEAEVHRRALAWGILNRIRLLGFRNDVERLLAAADIFVLPARSESFGIVLLEAMALGLPVVATAVDGIPEVVADGETGVLVPSSDCPALSNAVLVLAADPMKRHALGRAGRERWARSFTLDRCVDATLEAYLWSQNRQA